MEQLALDLSTVTQKWGKLPIWAWGAIGGVGVLGFYYISKAKTTASSASVAATATDPFAGQYNGSTLNTVPTVDGGSTAGSVDLAGLQASLDLLNSNLAAQPTGTSSTGTTTGDATQTITPTPTPAPTTGGTTGTGSTYTTATWRVAAISKANANSSLSLTFSTTAIDAYLAGKPLTQTQYNQVMKAINSIGYPPGGAVGAPILTSGSTSTGGGNSTGGTSNGGGNSTGGTVTVPPANTPPGQIPPSNTGLNRAQWRAAAIPIAQTVGGLSLTYATNTVDKYLAGSTLDTVQTKQIAAVIKKLGAPPAA